MRTKNSLTSVSNAQGRLPRVKKKKKVKKQSTPRRLHTFLQDRDCSDAGHTADGTALPCYHSVHGQKKITLNHLAAERIIFNRINLFHTLLGDVDGYFGELSEIMSFNSQAQIFQ